MVIITNLSFLFLDDKITFFFNLSSPSIFLPVRAVDNKIKNNKKKKGEGLHVRCKRDDGLLKETSLISIWPSGK